MQTRRATETKVAAFGAGLHRLLFELLAMFITNVYMLILGSPTVQGHRCADPEPRVRGTQETNGANQSDQRGRSAGVEKTILGHEG